MRQTIRRVLTLLALPRHRLILAVAAGAAALGSATLLLACSAWLIARASQHPHITELTLVVVAVRALAIGRGVFRYLERVLAHELALTGLVRLREQAYLGAAGTPTQVLLRYRRGDLLERLGRDIDTVGDLVVRGLLPFASAAVVGVFASLLAAVVYPPAGLIMLAAFAVSGALAPWLAARAAGAELDAADATTRVSERAHALMDGLPSLELLDAVAGALGGVVEADHDRATAIDRARRPAALAAAVQLAALGFAIVVTLGMGATAVRGGTVDAVWLVVITLLPLAALEATTVLPAAAAELVRGARAAQRILDLVDQSSAPAATTVTDPEKVELVRASTGWTEPVLRELTLNLDLTAPGSIAVVGPSGSGKTSLLLTVAGLLPPLQGTAELVARETSVPLHQLAPEQARRIVLFTAEDAHIFGTTIRENVRVAAGPVDDQRVLTALDQVGLSSWVAGLPQGLDTPLGSGGVDVSGGQRRRLLLARALLTDAQVVLFDEPTEHLDANGAQAMLAQLAALPKATEHPRWVVVATHRRDVNELFDQVIDLETTKGTSAMKGTWE